MYTTALAVLLSACAPGNELQLKLQDYSLRLSRVLEQQPVATPMVPFPQYPRVRDLKTEESANSINPLDYLRLGDCELQQIIAQRNSSLGKLAQPSQRLVHEVNFLRAARVCEQQIRAIHPELADQLHRVTVDKRAALPQTIWQATLGGNEFRALWRFRTGEGLSRLQPEVHLTLVRLGTDIERWLTGDYEIDSARLEQQLSVIRLGNAGELAAQWMIVGHELSIATALLRQRLDRRPLCFPGMTNTSAASRFNAVVHERFLSDIQRDLAGINTDYYDLFPVLRALEDRLSSAETAAFREWCDLRDGRLLQSMGAVKAHVGSLQPLLAQCGLMPSV